MIATNSTLAVMYKGWEDYHIQIVKAVRPLTDEQLALRAAPHLRSIGMLVTHVIAIRISWFHIVTGEGSADLDPLALWDQPDQPVRTTAELVQGLETSWQFIQERIAKWTPEELEQPFERSRGSRTMTFTRQWIIWHIIEHDLHHGGEISFSLGMYNLNGIDISMARTAS